LETMEFLSVKKAFACAGPVQKLPKGEQNLSALRSVFAEAHRLAPVNILVQMLHMAVPFILS